MRVNCFHNLIAQLSSLNSVGNNFTLQCQRARHAWKRMLIQISSLDTGILAKSVNVLTCYYFGLTYWLCLRNVSWFSILFLSCFLLASSPVLYTLFWAICSKMHKYSLVKRTHITRIFGSVLPVCMVSLVFMIRERVVFHTKKKSHKYWPMTAFPSSGSTLSFSKSSPLS